MGDPGGFESPEETEARAGLNIHAYMALERIVLVALLHPSGYGALMTEWQATARRVIVALKRAIDADEAPALIPKDCAIWRWGETGPNEKLARLQLAEEMCEKLPEDDPGSHGWRRAVRYIRTGERP